MKKIIYITIWRWSLSIFDSLSLCFFIQFLVIQILKYILDHATFNIDPTFIILKYEHFPMYEKDFTILSQWVYTLFVVF